MVRKETRLGEEIGTGEEEKRRQPEKIEDERLTKSKKVFGDVLGSAFFGYVGLTNEDHKLARFNSRYHEKVSQRRDAFARALADKLTTGKREDVVPALTALLAAFDKKIEAVLASIRYNGPYAH